MMIWNECSVRDDCFFYSQHKKDFLGVEAKMCLHSFDTDDEAASTSWNKWEKNDNYYYACLSLTNVSIGDS